MIFLFFIACAPEAIELAPVGLKYSLQTVGDSVTTSYRILGEGEAVPSIGTLGTGTTCLLAGTSAGSQTTTTTFVHIQNPRQIGPQ